mmetsp:Transcript_10638/g.12811  ORF Transcript_10638/g.12811 Transcript_10638/m.12811 type:complete len:349 (-) Transcript_10638:131-1177(-)|eukprot:CAMPEP_0184036680 /NCGR_PEP_ID=MMETSP0955-20130417/34012_1 /TAXON_ID=627963 /ORGANISM="Aplanochytrium sp, Strain PBS07" /LENGTH=348 /DNA_ID=CAMNT_0026324419 /DNA_START=44 /DNA_END=1090 /DNA_ORIENTATION=+
MSGQIKEKKGPMDDVDQDAQERALMARAAKFREKTSKPGNKLKVVNEVVNIYSDGVRMSGTIWRGENVKPGDKLPCILLCHGWGGKRAHLDFSYAPKFAQAGFVAVTFDYRTWGDSDGVVVSLDGEQQLAKPDSNGNVTLKARIVRKVIDPEWQLRDIDSALNFVMGIENVDVTRIGLWGSSFGGGHVLATAAKDHRVSAVVCQIGSINTHNNWVNRHPDYKGVTAIQKLAIEQAQGSVFPWTIRRPIGLDGSPNLPKVVFEHTSNTIASVDKIECPTLILAAEEEELFKNEDNSFLVHDMLKTRVPTQLKMLPGGHYNAYEQPAYSTGLKNAIDWFQVYIGTPTSNL